jgi:hypothetical protein
VAAREANFTGSALLMTTFTMTMTTGSAWWARSLTTTAITTTGPTAGSRSGSTPELDGVGTAFGPATRLRLLRTERPTRRFLCSNVRMGLGADVTDPNRTKTPRLGRTAKRRRPTYYQPQPSED